MKKFLIISIATAAMMAGSATYAQQSGGAEPRGDMTRADAQTKAAERFAKMDVNSDGQLSDADREAKRRARFDQTDANGDGQLSYAEVAAAHEARKAMRGERRGEAGERRAGRGEDRMRGGKRGGKKGGKMMAGMDTDNSGTVSQAEFTTAALARFDRADANKDGTLTSEERQAQRGDRRGGKRERRQEGRAAQG